MIGISAAAEDLPLVEEFFELFKTPWERAVPSREYAVVIATNGCIENLHAGLFVIYGSREHRTDAEAGRSAIGLTQPSQLDWQGAPFPLFGRAIAFSGDAGAGSLIARGRPVSYTCHIGNRRIARIGYDLLHEVNHLLTTGQTPQQAETPTLELHVAALRTLLIGCGVTFAEVPPRPDGYDFVCCLTHDVDFYGIQRHGLDQTVAGFVGRATLGSVANFALGRRTPSELLHNWGAVASLPLMHLGLTRDFWAPLADYAKADAGRPATFFMVPFGGRPGIAPDGTSVPARAVPYTLAEISADVREAAERGAEIAVHGIDAWRDENAGRAERREVQEASGRPAAGVRMHWLYFDEQAPLRLEAAGFEYDSTWGYNAGIGYRAGTTQVFKLPGTKQLLELQLSIMDTALYYRDRMWLTPAAAQQRCGGIIDAAHRFGGAVVINWHDRSLAPERLWGRRYQALLAQVEDAGRPWFATASDAVSWFRWRRSISFSSAADATTLTVTSASRPAAVPGARLVVHNPSHASRRAPLHGAPSNALSDGPFVVDGQRPITVSL